MYTHLNVRKNRSLPLLRGQVGNWTRLSGCFLAVALSSSFVAFFNHGNPEHNDALFWVSNGVLLAWLLLAPRWRWPYYLAAGFAGEFVSILLIGERFHAIKLLLILLNLSEVLLGAILIRHNSRELPRFTDSDYLRRFLLFPVLIAPFAINLLFTLYYVLWNNQQPLPLYFQLSTGDALGIAVVTPAMTALLSANWSSTNGRRHWIYPVFLVLITVLAFSQSTMPLVFLVYPLLVMVLLRMGMGWATLSLLFVSVTSSLLTSKGLGPFATLTSASTINAGVLQQLFVAAGIILLYSVSVVLEKQKATEQHLQEIVELHRLVTENNRDMILLSDPDGYHSYVSEASLKMVGWTSREMLRRHSMDMVHPLDLSKAEAALQALHDGSEEVRLELRIQRRDESYIWVETYLRMLRDPHTGKPKSILSIVRDISARKQTEQQLRDAYNTVEAMAITDALTGLSNRRRFDQYLASEWRRSMRERQPLSLLMIDADFFKAYNDTYGHTRGDSCLKQIAEAAQDVVSRPGDMVARFGGEEFTVILPNTENNGAMLVGQEICASMARRALVHSGNPYGIMTISVGCATLVPHLGQHAVTLIEMADSALYMAKRSGRNRVCNSNESECMTFSSSK